MVQLQRLISGIALLISLQAVIAIPLLALQALGGDVSSHANAIAMLFGILCVTAVVIGSRSVSNLARRLVQYASDLSTPAWLIALAIVGITLRVLWVVAFPAHPSSDGATYLQLAERLAHGQIFFTADTRAYWPPGFPFFLSPIIALFGSSTSVIVSVQLLLFIGTITITHLLAETVFDRPTARLASALVTVWPCFIMTVGVPTKEVLIIPTIGVVLYFWIRRPSGEKLSIIKSILPGAILGFITLTQPAFILFPAALIAIDLAIGRGTKEILTSIALATAMMALVIAPWTVRNYFVFHTFVPITTNGGYNLYRANNPLATGGYTEHGAINLSNLDELTRNRAATKAAITWITTNPGAFLRLALRKQILFLGDDGEGVYTTLRRGRIPYSESTYVALKMLSNAFWLLLWLALLRGFLLTTSQPKYWPAKGTALVLPIFYLYGLHSVFESGSKYHMPLVVVLAILAARGVLQQKGVLHSDEHTLSNNFKGLENNATEKASILHLLHQFMSFGIVGGLATGTQYAILLIMVQLLHVGPVYASAVGYALSSVLNYTLNYRYTFQSRQAHRRAFPRFITISICGLFLNAVIMTVGVHYLNIYYILSQIFASAAVLVWNFLANRRWSFYSPENIQKPILQKT